MVALCTLIDLENVWKRLWGILKSEPWFEAMRVRGFSANRKKRCLWATSCLPWIIIIKKCNLADSKLVDLLCAALLFHWISEMDISIAQTIASNEIPIVFFIVIYSFSFILQKNVWWVLMVTHFCFAKLFHLFDAPPLSFLLCIHFFIFILNYSKGLIVYLFLFFLSSHLWICLFII